MSGSVGSMNAFGGVTKTAENAIESMGAKSKNVFKEMGAQVNNFSNNFNRLVAFASTAAIGGAVAGLSYISAAKSDIAVKAMEDMGDTIKAWRLPKGAMKDAIEAMGGEAYTTSGKVAETIGAAMTLGQKIGLKGTAALQTGQAAEMVAAAKNTLLGGISGEDLANQALRIKGALPSRGGVEVGFREATADAAKSMGNYNTLMLTATGRAKILREEMKYLKEGFKFGIL